MAYSVLTVCTGNICRSPMAEALLREAFAKEGLDVTVDSAGISDEERGNPIDPRAARALAARGLKAPASHRARKVTPKDLKNYDLVIPMTAYHARHLRQLAGSSAADIRLWRSFDEAAPPVADIGDEHLLDVDDPWYGGPSDFATCLAQLVAATPGVVEHVRAEVQAG